MISKFPCFAVQSPTDLTSIEEDVAITSIIMQFLQRHALLVVRQLP